MIRALLADDQAVVRAGLSMILEAQGDIEIVGQAVDGREAVELTRALDPDVVLMDIRMPVVDGIEATRRLVSAGARGPILILTTPGSRSTSTRPFAAGPPASSSRPTRRRSWWRQCGP